MSRDGLIYLSATSLAHAIRTRVVSSAEVVEAYLQRIEAVNPQLNAIVQVNAHAARIQAREADAALVRGEPTGPLHGVPFTVKDVFDTAGLISAAGLEERTAFAPMQDATVVTRLRAAGGILLGKTNTPKGGMGGTTTNPVYGRTNNPYHLAHSPGGSSGGEAAIIAAGGSPLGLGSDSGGSIRLPAHYCGIAGLKPTTGRVPCTGTFAHRGGLSDPRTQIGPMARFVTDLWLGLSLIAGVDWQDSSVIPMPLGDPHSVNLQSLRIAYYADDGISPCSRETIAAVHTTVLALTTHGLAVEEARPSRIEETIEITQGYWRHSAILTDDIDNEGVIFQWDRFRSAMLAFMQQYDVIVCPADAYPAPLWEPRQLTEADARPPYSMFSYTMPYNLTGQPAVVVRAGASPEGLPIGVQIIARPWREDVAIAVAQHVETALGGWQHPPL